MISSLELKTKKLVEFFKTVKVGERFWEMDRKCAIRWELLSSIYGRNPRVLVRRDNGVEMVLVLANIHMSGVRFVREDRAEDALRGLIVL